MIFADNKLDITHMVKIVYQSVENIVAKKFKITVCKLFWFGKV